ncbi:uncharacterized protein LOC133930433 [Phragmites australis]|uniref:uncharacterized protein LOC133930433 n=1 Tax=Phragmites australis TaxID=29695 RepID=UPI002D77B173|nr:uncharacterized protein LOC133930433 [Phragmites australis]
MGNSTSVSSNGHVIYARPNNSITVQKNGVDIDNRFVVPHNVDLYVKYDTHINVESVNCDGMEKYLFKYTTKGFDCAKVGIQNRGSNNVVGVNEIKQYLDYRCKTPNDAAWRLLQFDIHHTNPSLERLNVHLSLENNVLFAEDDWTWHADGKYWAQRRNDRDKIGRITNVIPNEGEVFYMRMLLHIAK